MPSVSSMATQAKSSTAALRERMLAAGLLGGERGRLRGGRHRSPSRASSTASTPAVGKCT